MNDDDNTDHNINVVHQLPELNEAKAAGEQMRRNFEYMIDNADVIARFRRAAFVAYVEAGFTREEALILCTK